MIIGVVVQIINRWNNGKYIIYYNIYSCGIETKCAACDGAMKERGREERDGAQIKDYLRDSRPL